MTLEVSAQTEPQLPRSFQGPPTLKTQRNGRLLNGDGSNFDLSVRPPNEMATHKSVGEGLGPPAMSD